MKARDGWLVVDEAFADVEPAVSAVALCPDLPVLILRSFGKFYGLAGLRLGFAIGAPEIIARIATALGPWPVAGPALLIGAAALGDQPWADRTRNTLEQQAHALDEVLAEGRLYDCRRHEFVPSRPASPGIAGCMQHWRSSISGAEVSTGAMICCALVCRPTSPALIASRPR